MPALRTPSEKLRPAAPLTTDDPHPRMRLSRLYLSMYSLCLGIVASVAAFLWIALILYALSLTDPSANDLLMARYLDVSFGLLAFTSSLSLIYGAFVESKTWLSVWTLGSATVLVGQWSFLFYRKYGNGSSPESLKDVQMVMGLLSVFYALALLPVVRYYKLLESPDDRPLFKSCDRLHPGGKCPMGRRRAQIEVKGGFKISIPIGKIN